MNLLTTSSFSTRQLKYVVTLRRSRAQGNENRKPYIGLEHIESWTGRLVSDLSSADEAAVLATGESESLSSTFEPGDVLFGKLRPYLAKAWVAEFAGRCTTEALVMQPVAVEARFLHYVCLCPNFIELVDASTFGSKMPRAEWEFIGNIKIPVPPLPQQRAIADYLDRETARIDALIAAKKRLLELLAEKRRALITRAVTRGLDPHAPMRDSGIPWLGEIPAHWGIKRGKWLFRERDERSEDGEETLLSLRMERGLVPHNDVSKKQTRPEELIGYKHTSPGELVVNRMRAAVGLIAITREEGLVSPDYAVFIPSADANLEYYGYLFTTELLGSVFRSVSSGMGTGTQGFLRLYSESFLALWYPSPPLDEQRAIVEHITEETARLDALRAATERSIALLKERRAALIAAAVTGQIDVEAATGCKIG